MEMTISVMKVCAKQMDFAKTKTFLVKGVVVIELCSFGELKRKNDFQGFARIASRTASVWGAIIFTKGARF